MNNYKQGIKAKEMFSNAFFPSRVKKKYTPFPNISFFFTLDGEYTGLVAMVGFHVCVRSYRNRPGS